MPLAEVAAIRKNGSQAPHDRAGMPLAEVAAIRKNGSQAPRDLFLEEHEPERDDNALSQLAIWCEQFSPIVGLEDADAPSSLLLSVTGLAPIFGSESRLLQLVHEAFTQRGYRVQMGLADTVGAAWAFAHCDPEPHIGSAIPTKAVTTTDRQRLDPLPIESLRLPEETSELLHQLGVETVSQLLQLPRDGLAVRLGETLIQRIDQALGEQSEVIVAHRPPPEFAAEWDLEHPTTRRDTIEAILTELTNRLTETLSQHDHAAVQIEALLSGQRASCKLQVSLFQPSSNPKHLLDLLRLQQETQTMREPVRRVRLRAITTVRLKGGQGVLWDEMGHNRDREVAQLVDRLSSRLGRECVFGLQAQAGALPEKSWRRKLLSDTIRKRRRQPTTAMTLKAPHRPVWLHDPPLPLRTTANARPVHQHGPQPPTSFEHQGRQYKVLRHWGPERIETGWWRGPSVRRDYYRVETTTGYRFWLFRQLDDGVWFLHGSFE